MKNEICGIYSITNIVNGKRLIGLSKNINKRFNDHKLALRKNKHKNSHLQYAWNKYRENNFLFEVLLICERQNLNIEEINLIKEFQTTDRKLGYNILEGGNQPKLSEETKKKISLSKIGEKNPMFGKIYSEEEKMIMKDRMIGSKNPMFGKPITDNHRNKLIVSHTGKNNFNFGKPMSEEQKRKIGEANKAADHSKQSGENHWNFGKKMSEETKRKIGESRKKAYQLQNSLNSL